MGQKCWIENLPVDEECIIVWGQFHCFCSSSPPCQNKKRLLEWILYGNAIDNEISWCWGCCSSAAAIWWKHCQSHIQESWVLLPKKLLSRLKQATNNLTPTLTVKLLNIKQQQLDNIAKLSASPSYHHCFHQHQYQQLLSHIWTPGNLDRCLEMAKIAPSHTYNIYWHSWFGPILNNFERLEVSFAESSLPIVWLSASEASALFKPERSYLITKLKFLLPR